MSTITVSNPWDTGVRGGRRREVAGLRVRWARVLLVLTVVAVASAGLLGIRTASGSGAGAARGDGAVVLRHPALTEHRVVPGDTLWAIAAQADPGSDPRAMLDRIIRLNNLASADVQLGQVLLVPARG